MAVPKLRIDHALPADIDGGQGRLCAVDEGACHRRDPLGVKVEHLRIGAARVPGLAPSHPGVFIARQAKYSRIGRWEAVQRVRLRCGQACSAGFGGMGAAPAFGGRRLNSIQVNQMAKALGSAVGHSSADHAGIRMHHQDHIVHFFCIHGRQHILDMRLQVDARTQQMRSLAYPRQSDGMGAVP